MQCKSAADLWSLCGLFSIVDKTIHQIKQLRLWRVYEHLENAIESRQPGLPWDQIVFQNLTPKNVAGNFAAASEKFAKNSVFVDKHRFLYHRIYSFRLEQNKTYKFLQSNRSTASNIGFGIFVSIVFGFRTHSTFLLSTSLPRMHHVLKRICRETKTICWRTIIIVWTRLCYVCTTEIA